MQYNVPVMIRTPEGRNILSIGVYPTSYGWVAWIYLGRARWVVERWLGRRVRLYRERPVTS